MGLKGKRRLIGGLLAMVMVLGGSFTTLAQGPTSSGWTATGLTPASRADASGEKQPAAARSSSATGQNRVSIVVKLDGDSVLTNIARSNARAGVNARPDLRSAASQQYRATLRAQQDAFVVQAQQIAPTARLTHRFDLVLGGVSLIVAENEVANIAALPGVKAVYVDEVRQLQTDRSARFIGATTIWSELGGQSSAGEGVIVGVLDSGIWPEHPSFSDPDPSGKPYAAPPAKWAGTTCAFGSATPNDDAFTCNNKLIGAYRFMATYEAFGPPLLPGEFLSARDENGHGTHTASTAAGNGGVEASIFDIPRGTISGIAPRAHIVAYKVCGEGGCYQSDSVAAIQQSIADGVDTINFSISGGSEPYADLVELAFLDAYAAGVFVAASAGNSGPGADTTDHRGPWVTTVAASTDDRANLSKLTVTASNGDSLEIRGASVTHGLPEPAPIVLPDAANLFCNMPFAPGTFTGKIVACAGATGRVLKGVHVKEAGAVGVILYNVNIGTLPTDNHHLPAMHVQNDDGAELVAFIESHSGVEGSFTQSRATKVQGDVMTAFSSRGGPGQTLGISKPDVTAPGLQILAAHTPAPADVAGGPPGELFQAIQGTSMSSPHVAGAGALLKALHPDWTPGQIKSALMTTALSSSVYKEDGVTPADPFDYGSGRIDLRKAGDPGLIFEATAEEYVALQDNLWQSNYPSLFVPAMPGQITVERSVLSAFVDGDDEYDDDGVWRLSVKSPKDLKVTVPSRLVVQPGERANFAISLDASDVPQGEVRHAMLTLRNDSYRVNFPITIVRGEPTALAMTKSCSPSTIEQGDATECSITIKNNSFENLNVALTDELPRQLRLVNGSVVTGTVSGNGVSFNGTLGAAAPPVISVGPGSSPAGFLPLADFGIAPIAGMGDETIENYNVPPFLYGGESYTSIGITSNGYAVVGGGTASDVNYINQQLPNPAAPNNVLAPFWTDLNPENGGAAYIGILTDGVNDWLVLEWNSVPVFSQPLANSFQIWIGLNGTEDVSFTYGQITSQGDGGFLTVGAENRFGNSGQNVYFDGTGTLPAAGTELVVSSAPGASGGTVTVTFSATGVREGQWTNYAKLTSDIFDGTYVVPFRGEVTDD